MCAGYLAVTVLLTFRPTPLRACVPQAAPVCPPASKLLTRMATRAAADAARRAAVADQNYRGPLVVRVEPLSDSTARDACARIAQLPSVIASSQPTRALAYFRTPTGFIVAIADTLAQHQDRPTASNALLFDLQLRAVVAPDR